MATPFSERFGGKPTKRPSPVVEEVATTLEEQPKKEEGETRPATEEERQVGILLQRRRVRDTAERERPAQEALLAAYNRDNQSQHTFDTLFEEAKKRPELSQDRNVQEIFHHETRRKHGYDLPDHKKAVPIFQILEEVEKKKEAAGVQYAPEDYEEFEVEYVDDQGKKQVRSEKRLKADKESVEARRERLANAIELTATAEGAMKGLDLPEELKRALYNSATKRVRLPVYKTPKGDIAFDMYGARRKLAHLYFTDALATAQGAGDVSDAQIEKMREKADQKSRTFMARVRDRNSGVFVVDVDPEGTTQELVDAPWTKGGRLLSPFRAVLAGTQTAEKGYNRKITRLEEQGWLDYLTNMVPSTVVGAALKAGCWGCEAHIRHLRDGYNIFDDFQNIGAALTPKPLERKELAKKTGKEGFVEKAPQLAAGITGTGAIILLEPDPLTFALAGTGAALGSLMAPGPGTAVGAALGAGAGKIADLTGLRKLALATGVGKVNAKIKRGSEAINAIDDYIKGLEEAAKLPPEEAIKAVDKAADTLRRQDATAANLLDVFQASELGLTASYARKGREAFKRQPAMQARSQELRAELTKNLRQRDKIEETRAAIAAEKADDMRRLDEARHVAEEDLMRFRDIASRPEFGGAKVRDMSTEDLLSMIRDAKKKRAKMSRGAAAEDAAHIDSLLKTLGKTKKGTPEFAALIKKIPQVTLRQVMELAATRAAGSYTRLRKQQAASRAWASQVAKADGALADEMRLLREAADEGMPKFLRAEQAADTYGTYVRLAKELRDSLSLTINGLRVARRAAGDENPLRAALISAREDGGAIIDTVKLQEELFTQHGVEVVTEFLRRATDEAPDRYAQILGRFLREKGPRTLSREEVSDLRQALESLEIRADTLVPKGHRLGRAFLDEAFAPGNRASDLNRGIAGSLRRAINTFRPIQSRLGAIRKTAAKILKVSTEAEGAFDQELGLIYQRFKNDPQGFRNVLNTYLTTNTPIKLKNLPAIMNQGNEPPMQQAARQILSDPTVQARLEALLLEGEYPTGSVPGALQALARVWLPDFTAVPPKYAEFLVDATLLQLNKQFDELKAGAREALDMKELMDHIRRYTKDGWSTKEPLADAFSMWYGDGFFRKGAVRGEAQFGGLGGATASGDKAWSYASQAVVHSAMLDRAGNMVLKAVGGMSPELASKVNKVMTGAAGDLKPGEIQEVWGALADWGRPFLQTEYRAAKGAAKSMEEFVHLTTTMDGLDVQVPKRLYDVIDARMGNIVKSLAARSEDPTDIMSTQMGQRFLKFLQIYRASLTTGVLIPNPRYWNNNVFGDFSQMWEVVGLPTAAKLSFQNLPTNLPFGRQIQDSLIRFSEKHQGVPVLGTWMNAMFNPNLAKFFRAEGDELVRLGDGTSASVKEIRDWMAEDGVLDTFITETVEKNIKKKGADFEKFFPELVPEAFTDWQNMVIQHATFVQQRQRAAFYLEMLQQGMTRPQAADALRKALYDWKAPFAQAEQRILLPQLFTFYRFFRLAALRTGETLLEGMTAPTPGNVKRLFFAPTRSVARVRQMGHALKAPPKINYWYEGMGDQEQAQTDEEYIDAAKRDMRFWWQGARPQWWSRPIEQWDVDYQEKWGLTHPYKDVLLPPFTPVDLASQIYGITMGMAAVMAGAAGVPVSHDAFASGFAQPLAGLTIPVVNTMLELWLKSLSSGTHYVGGGRVRLRPGEVIAMKRLAANGVIEEGERGELYVSGKNAQILAFVRALPLLGTQIPHHVAAVSNPGWEKSTGKGIELMLATLLGVQPRYKDPYRDLMYDVREAKQTVEDELRRAEGRRRSSISSAQEEK